MNRRLVVALMFVAIIVMACNGPSPGVEAARDAPAATPTFSAEEFKKKVLDVEPKGMAIRFDSPLADVVAVESVTVEAEIAIEPERAARMMLRMVGQQVVQIEVIVKGMDLYLRGGIDDDFGDWMRSAVDEGAAFVEGLPIGDLESFGLEGFGDREWSYAGDVSCPGGTCFAVESQTAPMAKLHLRMSDYAPVQIVQLMGSGDGAQEITIEVLAWNEVVDVQVPTTGVRDVAPQEMGAAMLGLFMALG